MKRTVRKGILALGGMLLVSSAALGQHKFDHVQYLKPWTKGQKQGSYPVKGSLVFDRDRKAVEFLDEKNNEVISFPNENITSISVALKDASWLLNPIVVWVPKCFLTFRYKDTEGAVRREKKSFTERMRLEIDADMLQGPDQVGSDARR